MELFSARTAKKPARDLPCKQRNRASIDEPGGGKRVRLTEPNGYQIEVVCGIAPVPPIS